MKSAGVVDGGLFTESYCNICNAQLISESQRTAHYEVSPSLLTQEHFARKMTRNSTISGWQIDSCTAHFASALFVPICACAVQDAAHPLYMDLMQHGNAGYTNKHTHALYV